MVTPREGLSHFYHCPISNVPLMGWGPHSYAQRGSYPKPIFFSQKIEKKAQSECSASFMLPSSVPKMDQHDFFNLRY